MDKVIEKIIIDSFVVKRKRERILYERSDDDKRRWSIHEIEINLDPKYMFEIKQKISCVRDVYDILAKYDNGSDCYVMDLNDDSGRYMKLFNALENHVFLGPVLISIIHGKIAYFEGEQSYGAPFRYILRRE